MLGLPSHESINKKFPASVGEIPKPPNDLGEFTLKPMARALEDFSAPMTGEEFDLANRQRWRGARLLIKNGEFLAAQKLLRAILQRYPYAAEAIREMAFCAGALGRHEERARLIRALVAIDDHPNHLIALADVLYDLGRDQEALRYYLTALRTLEHDSPLLFDVYKSMGNIFVRTHDFESAEDNYNKAYTLRPESAALLVNFGTLEIQRQQWDGAISRFREAIMRDGECDRAWVGLAICHRHFGDHELSWANLARAMDLNPENTTALQLALSWVAKDERWDQVARWLENFLVRRYDDALMSLALAQIWFLRSRWAEAEMELTRALSLDPQITGGSELWRLIENEKTKGGHGRQEPGADSRA